MKITCNICETEGDFVESTDVTCLTCYHKMEAKAELVDELLAACKAAIRLLNANTTLDAGNPANIAIGKAIAKAEANS